MSDREELEKWARILQGYSRPERPAKAQESESKVLPDEINSLISHTPTSKEGHVNKGPTQTQHAVNIIKNSRKVRTCVPFSFFFQHVFFCSFKIFICPMLPCLGQGWDSLCQIDSKVV